MRHQLGKINFNKEWALKAGKDYFLKHFKDAYPLHDLEVEWDKISPPKKEEKVKK